MFADSSLYLLLLVKYYLQLINELMRFQTTPKLIK